MGYLISILLIAGFGLYKLVMFSTKVHEDLDRLELMVSRIDNMKGCERAWEVLCKINKRAIHSSHSFRISKIGAIIDTKIEFYQ